MFPTTAGHELFVCFFQTNPSTYTLHLYFRNIFLLSTLRLFLFFLISPVNKPLSPIWKTKSKANQKFVIKSLPSLTHLSISLKRHLLKGAVYNFYYMLFYHFLEYSLSFIQQSNQFIKLQVIHAAKSQEHIFLTDQGLDIFYQPFLFFPFSSHL